MSLISRIKQLWWLSGLDLKSTFPKGITKAEFTGFDDLERPIRKAQIIKMKDSVQEFIENNPNTN